MATHSNTLAWRIPGTVEPGGLPSMGLHRVGHDWSDLAAAGSGFSNTGCFPTWKTLSTLFTCYPTPPAPPPLGPGSMLTCPCERRNRAGTLLVSYLILSNFYCLCMFYDVHGILVQAVHNNSWIVIHIYGGKHATLLFISTLRVQASRCWCEGVKMVRFTINGNWERRGPRRVQAPPKRMLPSSLPCQDGGCWVLWILKRTHTSLCYEIFHFWILAPHELWQGTNILGGEIKQEAIWSQGCPAHPAFMISFHLSRNCKREHFIFYWWGDWGLRASGNSSKIWESQDGETPSALCDVISLRLTP